MSNNKMIDDFRKIFSSRSELELETAVQIIKMTMEDACLDIDTKSSCLGKLGRINPAMESFVLGYVGDGLFPPYVEDKEEQLGLGDSYVESISHKKIKVSGGIRPTTGDEGEVFFDAISGDSYIYYGGDWILAASSGKTISTSVSEEGIYGV